MILGIDIGGTDVKYGVYDKKFQLIKHLIKPSKRSIALLDDLIETVKNDLVEYQFEAIGIGVAGFVLEDGYLFDAVNLQLKDINIVQYLNQRLNINCYALNDANAACFGENHALSTPKSNVLMLTLGTGVGAGIICNNQLVIGVNGAAGEIGHTLVDTHYKFKCNCGNHGCLETLASATGIQRLYYYHADLEKIEVEDDLSCKAIFDLAKAGDQLANMVIDIAVKHLAIAIHNTVAIINSEVVIIGGGVANAKEFLLDKIDNEFKKVTIPVFKNTRFSLASLKNDAGIFGLAKYAAIKANIYYEN